MITYGIILLILGVILWAVGRILAPRPPSGPITIAGEAIAAIGVILLIVGVLVLVLSGADNDIQIDSLRQLVAG